MANLKGLKIYWMEMYLICFISFTDGKFDS